MIGDQPALSIRIVIETDGDSYQRDYVRGQEHIGQHRFVARSIGDLLLLVGQVLPQDAPSSYTPPAITKITWFELTGDQVIENRKYHHTTH